MQSLTRRQVRDMQYSSAQVRRIKVTSAKWVTGHAWDLTIRIKVYGATVNQMFEVLATKEQLQSSIDYVDNYGSKYGRYAFSNFEKEYLKDVANYYLFNELR